MSRDANHDEAKLRVLVIDDEREGRDAVVTALRPLGCRIETAENGEAAIARMRAGTCELAFCDLMLGEEDGVELVPRMLAINPDLHVVVVTGFGSIDSAVRAVKAGAGEYLQKPVDPAQVRAAVERVQADRARMRSMSEFERGARSSADIELLASKAPAMQQVLAMVGRTATADIPVLLRGESGTGKGVLATAIHRRSERREDPFVTVNCPSLSDELLSSELFGHIKGSFTGAVRDQPGKVEVADGGTLFLDELGDLSQTVQAKLLRFLQEHRYERVGDTETRIANVRIIAATNRDLEAMVADGRFREDLFYRLNVIEVAIPPLRERREDVLDLAKHFLAVFAAAANRPPMELSPAAEQLVQSYPWPGNVRELRNEFQRLTVLWPSRTVESDAFSKRITGGGTVGPMLGGDWSLDDIESEHIRKVLAKADTFEQAAQILKIEPSTLWRRRKRLGL